MSEQGWRIRTILRTTAVVLCLVRPVAAQSPTISAPTDTVVPGAAVQVTIHGAPGHTFARVGLCVRNLGGAALSNTDWVNGWVMVVNP